MQHLTEQTPLDEWLSYLENSHFKAIDLGLERVKSVAQALDLLQPAPFVITVGGTNGKGTTCRLLESILLNAGYRVGVYSSPHLIRYNERVRIQNQELSDSEHTASFAFIEQHKTQSLTYFEFSTLSALHLFKQAKLDVVILEVGLGGRLDATNIIDSNMTVITSIDIDHIDFLGNNREQIAFEKAGIFRPNCWAIVGEPHIPQSIFEQAKRSGSSLFCRELDWQFSQLEQSWSWQSAELCLQDLPLCNIPLANAATALAAVAKLPFTITEKVITQSLQQVELTGRFQKLKPVQLQKLMTQWKLEPIADVIIDVGHNPHAARYLAQRLQQLRQQGKNIYAVCGILQDKDAEGIFSPLLDSVKAWYCVGLEGQRGQTGEQLLHKLQNVAQQQNKALQAQSADNVIAGVKLALREAKPEDIVVVFGSFHTVGALLALL